VGYPLKSFPLCGGVHWVFISTGQPRRMQEQMLDNQPWT